VSAGVLMMPKRKPGRPENGRPNRTESVRVRADLAQLIGLVADARRQREAEMLDMLIRPVLHAEYARLYPVIRQLHAESVSVAAARGEEPPPPLPVVLTADPQHPGQTIPLEELHTRPPAAEKKRK
jgi:hypothetical protein